MFSVSVSKRQINLLMHIHTTVKLQHVKHIYIQKSMASQFWARVIHAVANAVIKENIEEWGVFEKSPIIPFLTIDHVRDFIKKCLPEFAKKPIFLLQMSFSRVMCNNKSISDDQRCAAISSITQFKPSFPCLKIMDF